VLACALRCRRQRLTPMSPLPAGLRPMLAVTTATLPADAAAWAAEVKWDGYRALCLRDDDGLRLESRRGTDMAAWFPELGGLHRALGGHQVVVDGEVVAIGADGRPAFELLQQRMRRRPTATGRRAPDAAPVAYLVFDLLWLDGRLVTGLPFTRRRELLEGLELAGASWQTTSLFVGQAAELLAASRQQGLEGVVVKRLQSPYRPGRRSADWRKLLNYHHDVFVVGGYVPGPDGVAALLVGDPDPQTGLLRFVGRVDHGMLAPTRRRLAELLAGRTAASPFQRPVPAGGRWGQGQVAEPALVFVRPEVAVRVRYLGWEAGRLRHPAYRGVA
jgi:bifunctional non-homologous end joining protein LigD